MDKERKRKRREEHTIESTYKIKNFYACLPKCRENVSWKASVQCYMATCVCKIYQDYLKSNQGNLPRSSSDKKEIIRERGKPREITPIHIRDRENQKVLCDFALTPALLKYLIYDNGASLKNKGVEFSRARMLHHLESAIKDYGNDFYILVYDFKGFFDSIPHKSCYLLLKKYFADERLINMTMEVIKSPYRSDIMKIKDPAKRKAKLKALDNNEMRGICLGSQVSQIMALVIANDLDHYIKDGMRVKGYIRYMDDGVVIAKTKEELKALYEGMKKVCERIGLCFNKKKTHITKSRKGFTFLKVKYSVLPSGRILRRLSRDGVIRMRRKLKKFVKKVENGDMTKMDVYNSLQSWVAHSKIAKSYHTVRRVIKLYKKLFGVDYAKKGGGANVLQNSRWEKYRWNCAVA